MFVQDDWRIGRNLTVSLGVRYDYDTEGNNPDFTHPVEPEKRHVDDDNIQPRLAFVWDRRRRRQQRGPRRQRQVHRSLPAGARASSSSSRTASPAARSTPGSTACSSACPRRTGSTRPTRRHTGVLLAPNIALLEPSLEAPEAIQSSLGFTQRLGDTGLFVDLEAVYVEGDNEIVIRDINWSGNATHTRPNTTYDADQRVHQRGPLRPTRRSWPASTGRSRAAT